MSGNPDIEAGMHFCHRCKKVTGWAGDRLQRCAVCGRQFPCAAPKCTHEDCIAHRLFWGTNPSVTQEPEPEPEDLLAYLAG